MKSCSRLNQHDPRLFARRGIVPDATRNDEELACPHRHRTAIRFSSADAELTTQDQKHLVLVFMRVPGKLPLHFRHFDVLIVDLTNDSRRPKLRKIRTRQFQRDGVLLGLLPFEF